MNNLSDFELIMKESRAFKLFYGLLYKKEVKNYFDYILCEIIDNFEKSGNNKIDLIFKVSDLYLNTTNLSLNNLDNNNIEKKENEEIENNNFYKNKALSLKGKINTYEQLITEDIKKYNNFSRKYLIDINKKFLDDLLNQYQNDENMKIYINDKINLVEQKSNIFCNNIFIDEIKETNHYETILNNYQRCFNIVIDMINIVMDRILKSSKFIPYSIKYICKIIYNLLIKKFQNNISQFQISLIILKFFFMKIFQYYFLYPEHNSNIDPTIISQETQDNLLIIFNIFKKFLSTELYENKPSSANYVPFNLFFIENTPKLFKICEKLLDINLPKEKENKSENDNDNSMYSYSFCFNVTNLTTLLNIIKHNSEKFFEEQKNDDNNNEKIKELEIIYNKIKNNKDIFKSLKEKNIKYINYYLIYEIFYPDKIKNVLFNSINTSSKYFKISENDKQINNIIHCKNLICDILYSIDLFNINKISNKIDLNNLKEILIELSNYYSILNSITEYTFKENEIGDEEEDENFENKNSNYYNQSNNTLPIEWYINSLIIYLDKLDDEYKKDNYHKLLESLYQDINNSISKYDFKILSQIAEKLKNTHNYILDYISYQKLYDNININSKIKNFIYKEKIEIKIKYKYNIKDKIFKFRTKNTKNTSYLLNIFKNQNKKDSINNININEFCKKFPEIKYVKKKENIDINVLTEEENNIQPGLTEYFEIIKEYVNTKFLEEEREIVNLKIQKYFFEFSYYKLFPKEPNNDDIAFNCKTLSLSWIKAEYFNLNNINFNNILILTNKYFKQIDNEHWPLGKFKLIEKIFDIIQNIANINKGGNSKVEDIKIICEYIIIKANPGRFISNLKYLQMFLPKNNNENQLTLYYNYLKLCMNNINNLNYKDFHGITEEEFELNCNESLNKKFMKNEKNI